MKEFVLVKTIKTTGDFYTRKRLRDFRLTNSLRHNIYPCKKKKNIFRIRIVRNGNKTKPIKIFRVVQLRTKTYAQNGERLGGRKG